MNDAAFDTLKFARTLRERANLSQDAAEGFADAFAGALQGEVARRSDVREAELRLEARFDRLDAKVDAKLVALEHRLDVKIEALEHRLDVKIEALRSDMLKWVYGAVGFQTLVTLGGILALARFLAH